MIHQCERLPFRLEAGNDALGVHTELDDLERDPAANGFLLLGHIYYSTAAFADLPKQFVAAYAVAGFLDVDSDGSARPRCRAFEEAARLFASLKEFFDALTHGSVTGAGLLKIR
jgi:hypothetical protein